ncbi:hypothetical protein F5Y06DRAFT_286928 [Hypoxylon sp. FL0890]|nr:hypothetical protein F5Y06DRAFT_286928 [Hypoxylon sp. FL0890]
MNELRTVRKPGIVLYEISLVLVPYSIRTIRVRLGIQGSVTFESHMNLGDMVDAVSESVEHMAIAENVGTDATTPAPKRSRPKADRRVKRGKNGPADQFCIYKRSDGRNVPALAIEYKAPHKLTRDEVVTGLRGEIQPERDVINKDGKGFAFASRRLAAAVVTQLFSYMTFIFLYILDDPSVVYYSVCVPNLDVLEDDENRLHRTAAFRSSPLPLTWHDHAEGLDTWAVEFEDVEDEDLPPSPSASRSLRSSKKAPVSTSTTAKGAKRGRRGRGGTSDGAKEQMYKDTQMRIQDRPFCTQKCLSGLASGGPIDDGCPNFSDHTRRHISLSEFQCLIRAQSARDRGPDADAMPLYLSGSVGALFKIRLSSHGYTLGQRREAYSVCIGNMDLVLPYYYDGSVFKHFLFLGWAGRPLFDLPSETDKTAIVDAVSAGFKAVHDLHVLYGDAEPRNILYDTDNSDVMIVDFKRAKLLNREPLGLINLNRKRKHTTCQDK